ncbi:ferritin-like domain-containing protein [Streptomyces sp. NPDC006733]|uniref:ferritin-like domain-containing protein n=1 Tax=Streptomyces sp. NPDC006733 TaxID=3155460 RepID=UPI0033FFF077
MSGTAFAGWTRAFEAEVERRRAQGDPDWAGGATLGGPLTRSLQRFQVGEDGDGANLIRKADEAGDREYAAAVRLFVAEEQNHARLLAALLGAGGRPLITAHWSDSAFVRLRRLLGLRLELLVLMIAEVVALRYYRAVSEGAGDPLVSEVAARILADERRHVPFHCLRLRQALGALPHALRVLVLAGWRLLLLGATAVVVWDHGPALRHLGVGRRRFAADVMRSSTGIVADILGTRPLQPADAAPVGARDRARDRAAAAPGRAG